MTHIIHIIHSLGERGDSHTHIKYPIDVLAVLDVLHVQSFDVLTRVTNYDQGAFKHFYRSLIGRVTFHLGSCLEHFAARKSGRSLSLLFAFPLARSLLRHARVLKGCPLPPVPTFLFIHSTTTSTIRHSDHQLPSPTTLHPSPSQQQTSFKMARTKQTAR